MREGEARGFDEASRCAVGARAGGIVVTPRGVGMLDHAWQDIRTFLRTAPELAPYSAKRLGAVPN